MFEGHLQRAERETMRLLQVGRVMSRASTLTCRLQPGRILYGQVILDRLYAELRRAH